MDPQDGSLVVADTYNHRLRRVSPHGIVSTIAGSGQGFADGVGTAARFNMPWAIVMDAHGTNVYTSDSDNHCTRIMTPMDGEISTVCGSAGIQGFADGQGTAARFNEPVGLAFDTDCNIIVADLGNYCIRKVALPDGRATTVAVSRAGGAAGIGFADGEGTAARFNC